MSFYRRFPVPDALYAELEDSYLREHIPGTNKRYSRGRHYAIDVPGSPGRTSVLAGRAGRAYKNPFGVAGALGLHVAIRHRYRGRRWWSMYAHLDSFTFRHGARLRSTTKVGLAGTSGQSSGEHVHIELRRARYLSWSGDLRNPCRKLRRSQRRERRRTR